MYLSVIIPAYNEERRLPKTLEEIDKYLSRQSYPSTDSGQADYEILVVNDGSKDRTVEVAKGLIPNIKNLKVVGYEQNRGKGFAVRFGMLEAKGDYRLFTDADNSTSVDQIEKMWPWFSVQGGPAEASREGGEKGFDVVIGSRDIKGAILDPPQPWIRHMLLGEGFKLFRKLVVDLWGIEDTQCGFKCFKKSAAENIFPKCKIDRFAFDPEILVIAEKLGYKIKEIPVTWRNDLESKVKFMSIFKMALDLFKIKFNSLKGIYDKKI